MACCLTAPSQCWLIIKRILLRDFFIGINHDINKKMSLKITLLILFPDPFKGQWVQETIENHSPLYNFVPSMCHKIPLLWEQNWPNSQFPECTCSISHNAPFRTEMCTFLFWMEHWGIWNRCILGFVKLVYCRKHNFSWLIHNPWIKLIQLINVGLGKSCNAY